MLFCCHEALLPASFVTIQCYEFSMQIGKVLKRGETILKWNGKGFYVKRAPRFQFPDLFYSSTLFSWTKFFIVEFSYRLIRGFQRCEPKKFFKVSIDVRNNFQTFRLSHDLFLNFLEIFKLKFSHERLVNIFFFIF